MRPPRKLRRLCCLLCAFAALAGLLCEPVYRRLAAEAGCEKMIGYQAADPCRPEQPWLVVESALVRADSLRTGCEEGAVTLAQLVIGVPTMARNISIEDAYLPAVVGSLLKYLDPAQVYLMKAGDPALEHPVRSAAVSANAAIVILCSAPVRLR